MKEIISQICEVKAVYSTKIKASERPKIRCSSDIIKYFRPFFAENMEQKELVFMMLLDRGNKILGIVKIGEGSAVGCVIDIQYCLRIAILTNAQAVCVCHNHPSGELRPSESDKTVCKKLQDAMKLVDITMIDNLIITESDYYSFADEGLIY